MALEREKALNAQREMLTILGASGEDYLFLWDFATNRVFWGGAIEGRYPIQLDEMGSCALEDWCRIVYPMDWRDLSRKIEGIRRGKEDHYDQQYRLMDRQGARVWVTCRGRCQRDEQGRSIALIGRMSDTLLECKVDPLTGAFNVSELTEEVGRIQDLGCPCFLLIVGVDNLKGINLRAGREYGNQILRGLADTLEELVEGRQRIYRVDSDCFAVNLYTEDKHDVEKLYRDLAARMTGKCTISAGAVAYCDHQNVDAAALYQYAEETLDKAKRIGKNTIAFFSQKDYEEKLSTMELQEELQHSIQNGFEGFSLCYQPQIVCQSYELFGAEVLLRYTSATRGKVSPVEIIPVLEKTGMICQVGLWVLQNALEQCKQWRKTLPKMGVSVNVSYVQLSQPDITQQVLECLQQSGLPGEALTLEVTESMQLQDYSHFNKIFYRWKQAGIKISVDDFGTGYSSLGYLKNLEVDEIKIDRCFVRGIQRSAYNYRLISNMVELAKSSQIRVCCEGVETREELAVLEKLGPDLIQGFLFNPPLTQEVFAKTYVQQDTPEYVANNALRGELGRMKKGQVESLPREPQTSEDPLDKILEALDEIVYVSDRVTYELYYLNPAGRRLTGAYDYKGQKCYKVLQGRDDPCEFCTNSYLKKESFYIWERENPKLNRHFILKDKLIPWQGKLARLELAVDITEREVLSRSVQEKLDFAESLLTCAQVLVEEKDMRRAVKRVLASAAQFYQAEQGYLFEPVLGNQGLWWSNTCEWSASEERQQQELPGIPAAAMERWKDRFDQNASVVISNVDSLSENAPGERDFLCEHGIRRMIISPIRRDGKMVAALGVSNPRHCIADDTLLRALGLFLAEQRLNELLNLKYRDVMKDTGTGLWVIRINPNGGGREMFADETMRSAMGLGRSLSPRDCYNYWYSRISEEFHASVELALQTMINSHQVVQLEYCWRHPDKGDVVWHCTGIRMADDNGTICLEGSSQSILGIETQQPDQYAHEVFEFNMDRKTILFHTGHTLLTEDAYQEKDFPEGWIKRRIVHPQFAERFRNLFGQNGEGFRESQQEVFLRAKNGGYGCFQLSIRPQESTVESDQEILLITLQPADRERVLQLENMRIRDFYQVSLSDAVAYAEVDLDSGRFKAASGLWAGYETKDLKNARGLLRFMLEQGGENLRASQDLEKLNNANCWSEILSLEEPVKRFRYQRKINGEWRWTELVAHRFREKVTGNTSALLYLKDIDAQVRKEQEQWKAASLDPLTRTYNRNAFEKALVDYMEDPSTPGVGAMILLDVDNFKGVNDQLGHLEGDNVLCRVTELLRDSFPSSVIGRLGGDEFVLFEKGRHSIDQVSRSMDRFFQKLGSYKGMMITCSAGILFLERETFSYQESLKQADVALYQSKTEGKNHYTYARQAE